MDYVKIVKKNKVMPESIEGFGVAYFFICYKWISFGMMIKVQLKKARENYARTNYRLFTLFDN